MEQDGSTIQSSRWLIEHMLEAKGVDRHMRSIAHQMKAARFPIHRDLAGFDFEVSPVDKVLIKKLANLGFTEDAQNVVLIGGPGTGKTHLATALGISGLTHHAKSVRFYSTVDLVNALEQEKAKGNPGRIAMSLMRMDLVILDELGYLPFSQAGGGCAEFCVNGQSTAGASRPVRKHNEHQETRRTRRTAVWPAG